MDIGYDRPLFILPFDQRTSYQKGLFGFKPPLTSAQTATVADSKRVIYEGFTLALSRGAPKEAAGILVDEEFGASILRDARESGVVTCAPVEKSGEEEFVFEYGERWREHIDAVAPTFVKVLVRYNPEGDAEMNRRQAARLKQVSEYARRVGRRFLFELLVPMTPQQSARSNGDSRLYDLELRPSLMAAAIKELQAAGVEPDVWKLEGLDRHADSEAVAAAARRGGRDAVGCIVLGRGASESGVVAWLRVAAAVPAFIGFAVGRTSFWDAVAGFRDGKLDRAAAARQIADRYAEWIRTFVEARQKSVGS